MQRLASMAAMFYMASLALFLRYRLSGTRRWYVLSWLSALMAMYTKEFSITLPAMIMLLEMCFFEGRARERALKLVPLALMFLVIPATMMLAGSGGNGLSSDMLGNMSLKPEISRIEYLLTQFGVVTKYLRLLLLPYGQNLDHVQPVYGSFAEPAVLMPFILLSAILGGACYLLYRSLRGRTGWDSSVRLMAFGVIWFFVTLSVESSIIPITDLIFEHRVYLPSVGIIMTAVTGLALILKKLAPHGIDRALVALCVAAVLIYTPLAYSRNMVWSSGSIWKDAVSKSPGKARAHANLCDHYLTKDNLTAALNECRIAVSLEGRAVRAYYNLALVYKKLGMQDMALRTCKEGLELYPDDHSLLRELGWLNGQAGDLVAAQVFLRKALEQNRNDTEAHNNLGIVMYKTGDMDAAAGSFRQALRLDPDNIEAHYNLSMVAGKLGLEAEALEHRRAYERLRSAAR